MNVLIIDDETKARSVLSTLLQENCSQCDTIYEASNLVDGVEIIRTQQPHIVFLDIEMPEHNGLEIDQFLSPNEMNFALIFVTAYSKYAIQAFELNAIDYILKPVSPSQIKKTVAKAIEQIGKTQIATRLAELRKSLQESNFTKIGLPHNDGIKFIDYKHIILIEADGMYTKVQVQNQEEIYVSKPLKFFVEHLASTNTFYKCHRSYLINLLFIQEYVRKDGGYILMENSTVVPISRDKRNEFLELIRSL